MFVLALALLAPLVVTQQPALDARVRFEKLDCGARVCAIQDAALPRASVQLWFRTGAAHDAPDAPGSCAIARMLLEQLPEAAEPIRGVDAIVGGRVLRDACFITIDVPANEAALRAALRSHARRLAPPGDVSADALRAAIAAAAERFDAQSPAQAEELADGAAAPDGEGVALSGRGRLPLDLADWRRVLAAIFPEHGYRNPPGVVCAAVAGREPREFRTYIENWLAPGGATIFVIGDVSPDTVMALAREALSGVAWREAARHAAGAEAPAEEVRAARAIGGGTDWRVVAAWRGPAWGFFDGSAVDLLMARLCNPVDGPLARRLRELGCRARWNRYAWRESGLVALVIDQDGAAKGPAPDDAVVAAALRDAIDEIAKSPGDETQLNRARALVFRDRLDARADPQSRALRLAAHEMVGGDVLLAEWELPQARSASIGDLALGVERLSETRRCIMGWEGGTEPDAREQALRPLQSGAAASMRGSAPVAASQPGGESSAESRPAARRRGAFAVTCIRAPLCDELVRVVVEIPAADAPAPGAAPRAAWDAGRIVDFCSYRGLRIDRREAAGRVRVRVDGPASELATMIDFVAGALLNPAPSGADWTMRIESAAPLEDSWRVVEEALGNGE